MMIFCVITPTTPKSHKQPQLPSLINKKHCVIDCIYIVNKCVLNLHIQTVEEAIQARREQHDKPIRPAGKHCQLGYGKTQISPRIIVGGLNEWATKDIVLKAFERYGEIESIEYEVGDSHAFIQ